MRQPEIGEIFGDYIINFFDNVGRGDRLNGISIALTIRSLDRIKRITQITRIEGIKSTI